MLLQGCSDDEMFVSKDLYTYERIDEETPVTILSYQINPSMDFATKISNIILAHEINNDGENYTDYGLNVYEYKNCYVFEKYKKEKDEDSQEEPKTYSVIITKNEMEAYK